RGSRARSRAEGAEALAQLLGLALEALQLVALLLHEVRGRALDEARIGELAAGAVDLGTGLRELLPGAGSHGLRSPRLEHRHRRVTDGQDVDGVPLARSVGGGRA